MRERAGMWDRGKRGFKRGGKKGRLEVERMNRRNGGAEGREEAARLWWI